MQHRRKTEFWIRKEANLFCHSNDLYFKNIYEIQGFSAAEHSLEFSKQFDNTVPSKRK